MQCEWVVALDMGTEPEVIEEPEATTEEPEAKES